MNYCRQHIFLLTLLLTACSSSQVQTEAARVYDSEVNCLNGTMIVSRGGEYGLADTCGKVVLPLGYDEIYFLTDDLAVAFTGNLCCYFDKSGQRLGECIVTPGTSPEELLEIYSRIERERRVQWDSILDLYGDLRRYCLSDSASATTASRMAEDIRTAVQKVGGPMEKDQKARFESEYSSYSH